MEILERIWEIVSGIGNAILGRFERGVTGLFGSSNARFIKSLQPKVDAINCPGTEVPGDDRRRTAEPDRRVSPAAGAGETLDDLLVEAFAVCREGGRRFLGLRHYDVQMIGGMVLHAGNIAEMVTGEGKTLVATLPAYLNAHRDGKGVHVVTVNDYLARRDMEWMGPLYMGLGLTVGSIQAGMDSDERQKSYACDITYGTNNEFGFDYLRDNMRLAARGDERYPKQSAAGAGAAALRDHRRSRQHPDRRSPHAADHLGPGPRRRHQVRARPTRSPGSCKKDVHFEVKEKEHTVEPDRRRRARGRTAGRRGKLLHGRQHGMAAPDRQLAQGPSPLQARRELRGARTARSSSSTSSPAA